MQGIRTRRKVGAMVLGVALVAGFTQGISAASGETTVPGTEPAGTEPAGTEPAGTEPAGTAGGTAAAGGEVVQCGFAPSDTTDGDLSGFAGTTPLTELSPEFFDQLCGIDPGLQDLNYAGEAYDTVVILALAVEARRTTESPMPARSMASPGTGRSAHPSPSAVTCSPPARTSTTTAPRVR